MRNLRQIYILAILLLFAGEQVAAQDTDQTVENDFEYRTYIDLSFKPIKKLKLSITPELRFEKDFSIDQYLIETELVYRPFKLLYLSGGYRFIINERPEKPTEYLHRYEFGAALKKDFDRFMPELKVRYSNYVDEDASANVLRYKAALGYNIKGCKLTPTLSTELFQHLSPGNLYKVRYKLDLEYKLFKKNYVGASYRFDYYLNEYKNNNIFSVGYKIKF
ncbi:MAG TPA: DUF2490 domain-containing protein [Bacteroidales bacterium]